VSLSVVIPVYNGARFLAEAVASVHAAARAGGVTAEVIVVDDGSTDESFALAGTLVGVRAFRQANAGAAAARNTGVAEAHGEILAFLDADDLWTPDKLVLQLAVFAADPGVAMVAGRVEEFGDAAQLAARGTRGERAYTIGALVVRRADFLRVGPFDPALKAFGEVMDWRSRALAAGLREHVLDAVVLRRRLHDANTTRITPDTRASYLAAIRAHLKRKRGEP
jgi:glycosyltransferase involved in cell wall biosynthesis